MGTIPANELVDALSKRKGVLDPVLFSESYREYIPTLPVNDQIRATLRDDQRRRLFSVLNSGVTIVAYSAWDVPESSLVMRDIQVVNGCQTCHVLAEERHHLDDVRVKVMVIEDNTSAEVVAPAFSERSWKLAAHVALRMASFVGGRAVARRIPEWRSDLANATRPVRYAVKLVPAAMALRRYRIGQQLKRFMCWVLVSEARSWTPVTIVLAGGTYETAATAGPFSALIAAVSFAALAHASISGARRRFSIKVKHRTSSQE